MPQTDLQTKINNMLDEIPNDRNREHTISRHDARWLANLILVIVEAGGCNRGLSEEQAVALKTLSPETLRSLKDMVKERRRFLAIIGALFVSALVYIGQKVLSLLDSNFWKALLARLSH